MAFIYERKPVFRVYDPDRGFELGSGPGAHGKYILYIHKMGDPNTYLGGGVEWEVVPLNMDNEEIDNAKVDNPIITKFLLRNPWRQRGDFVLSDYNKKETLEIISDALIKSREMTRVKKYRDKIIYTVVLAPHFEKWIEGE